MTKETGGQAFPMAASTMPNGEYQWQEYGMTLRDWFAGMAITGVADDNHSSDALLIAKRAYLFADAMIEARK